MRTLPALFIAIVAAACSRDANRDVHAAHKPTAPAGSSTTNTTPPSSLGTNSERPPMSPDVPPASPTNPVQPIDTTDASGQSNTQPDLDLLQKVRSAIANESSLSNSAKAVSVITRSGRVTLRGEVSSENEKERLLDLAREAAGQDSVDDELKIQSN